MILVSSRIFFLYVLVMSVLISRQAKAEEVQDTVRHHKVALVLSGGGAKGFAHIGVLKILEKEGIPIDLIVGTSMGSLIGGVYAIGYRADDIERIVKTQDWTNILSDDVPRLFLSRNDQRIRQRYLISLPYNEKKSLTLPLGVIKGQNVLNLLCGLAGNVPENADFLKFPIPFACVSANLETGKEVIIKNGFLPTALFSSMAIPGVFEPSKRDGMMLVDGGIVNNFPTDVAKAMGADIIIGVDIQGDFYTQKEIKSMGEILGQMINFLGMEKNSNNGSLCDLVIRPDITGYSTSSFTHEAADTLIRRGKEATLALHEQLEQLKAKYHLMAPKEKTKSLVAPKKWAITGLEFNGVHNMNETFLKKRLNLLIPGHYSYDDIKTAIDRLYGYGGFDKIYFTLTDNPIVKGKILTLNITKEKEFSLNIGFKVNTTDAAALLLNVTRKNYRTTLGLISASAELSANPGINLLAETNRNNFPALGIQLKGKRQNYSIYEDGNKIYNADLSYASGAIYLYQSFLKKYNAGVSITEEYFNGDVFSKSNNSSAVAINKTNHFNTNVYTYFSLDNMDNFYFPTKGTNLYAEFSFDTDLKNLKKLSPAILFKMKNVISVGNKTALLLNLYGRALLRSDYPSIKTTFIGGDSYSQYFSYHLPFIGLPPVTLADRYAIIGLIGTRIQLAKSQYISFLINGLRQENEFDSWWNRLEMTMGGGIKYSVKSIVGPIDVGLGYSKMNGEVTFSANLGYWF